MNRALIGVFDPAGRLEPSLAARALADPTAGRIDSGPLQLAFGGPEAGPGGVVCLLDGHLDTAAEIAAELDAPADAPAERLLALAHGRWGPAMLDRMRGDFALVVWDAEREEGLLARDQLGVRPLFIHRAGEVVRFATEIHRLLRMLSRRPAPDPAAVAHWLAVSSQPGSGTLYEGVERLGPGEVLLLDRRSAKAKRYWAPCYEEPLRSSPDELAGQVREALGRAVSRRSAPNGRTGVLMSGGLDSSAIAALSAAAGVGETVACSGRFPDQPEADESELIELLRRRLRLRGPTAEVRAGGLIASAVEHLDAWQVPLRSWGDFWTLELMRAAAAEGAGVMLDGDGGDELFGPRQHLLADTLRAGRPREMLALARRLPGAGPHVPRREIASVLATWGVESALPASLQGAVEGLRRRRSAPSWLLPGARRALFATDVPLAWRRLDGPLWWAYAAHGLAYGIEEAGVFENQRRRAELAGVEARHPMLDLDLVELGLRQPPGATLDPRFNRPVLRASVAGLLPDEVRLRPAKARFDSLIVSCLTGPDAALARHLLLDPAAELRAHVDQEEMRRVLFDPGDLLASAPFRWMWQVWRLLNAELWLRSEADPAGDLRLEPAPSPVSVSIGS